MRSGFTPAPRCRQTAGDLMGAELGWDRLMIGCSSERTSPPCRLLRRRPRRHGAQPPVREVENASSLHSSDRDLDGSQRLRHKRGTRNAYHKSPTAQPLAVPETAVTVAEVARGQPTPEVTGPAAK